MCPTLKVCPKERVRVLADALERRPLVLKICPKAGRARVNKLGRDARSAERLRRQASGLSYTGRERRVLQNSGRRGRFRLYGLTELQSVTSVVAMDSIDWVIAAPALRPFSPVLKRSLSHTGANIRVPVLLIVTLV